MPVFLWGPLLPGTQQLAVAGGIPYTITITPGALPITGQVVAPKRAWVAAITPSAVPISGAAVALRRGRVLAIAPSALPITGAGVAPTRGLVLAITPSSVPITGAAIAPLTARTITITPSAIPITGAALTPIRGGRTIAISPSAVPITGQVVTPTRAWVAAITPSSVPITGQSVALSTVTPLYFRPSATDSAGGWLTELGSATLHPSIDETVADDADYIRSADNPNLDVCKIAMTASGTPDEAFPITIRYRYRKQGGATIDLRVRLLESTTEIASWTHSAVTTSYVTGAQPLSAPEKASVGNWANLFLEFRADVP